MCYPLLHHPVVFPSCANTRMLPLNPSVRMLICVLLSLAPALVHSNNYIMHSTTVPSECEVQASSVMSNDLQLEICRRWTRNTPITNWNMSNWAVISDPFDPRLVEKRLHILPGDAVSACTISYTTTVKLPAILEKLTQITLSIYVQKQLFIYKQKVYSFVHIENVPLVKYLIISNVAGIIGHNTVTSKHMISHGEIPWYARWASDILKKEIIKSVDKYDKTCLEVYCANK